MARSLPDGLAAAGSSERRDPLDHWSLLASAVAGRAVDVVLTDRPRAYADGEAIHLPRRGFDDGIEEEDVMTTVVVQAMLLGAGSLEPAVVGHLTARRSLARRYLTLEAERAIRVRASFVPRRVAAVVSSHWSGSGSTSASESLDRARSREDVPDAPAAFGAVRPRALRQSGDQARGGAPSKLDEQGRTELVITPEMDDEEESESANFMKALSSPLNLFGENPLMKWMKQNLGVGSRPSPEGGGVDGEMPAGGASWGDDAGPDAAPVLAVASHLATAAPAVPPGRFTYPEWDAIEGCYRPDHCHVRELEPAHATEVVRPVPDAALQREIARLGLDYERHRRQLEGPDLDLEAVVDFTVSRARRHQADDRLYQVRLKTARDLAVLVLLDASGSTGDHRGARTIFDQERQVVANLVDVLERFGDRVGAFAFSSRGRGMVRFQRIKELDGRFDDTCLSRLAGVKPNGYTRLGAAIRHSTHVLAAGGGAANRLLLVVVSDGLPYDDGYEGAYADADTRRAIDEAVAEGVGCLCVSVGAAKGEDALAELWGSASQVRVDDPTDLGDAIGPLMRAALDVAAHRGGGACSA
ncbi:MAG TPA: VWA domain-containing protein [Acidimicrobiales bacterium]